MNPSSAALKRAELSEEVILGLAADTGLSEEDVRKIASADSIESALRQVPGPEKVKAVVKVRDITRLHSSRFSGETALAERAVRRGENKRRRELKQKTRGRKRHGRQ